MAQASVQLTANSNDFRSKMRESAASIRELTSEFSVANTRAQLFGTATDGLRAKAESLSQKITLQKNVVKMNGEEQERLTTSLNKQKNKHEELKAKVEDARKAYDASKKATGENSEESIRLRNELDKLEKEYRDSTTAIERTETALSNQTVKTNKSKVSLMEMEAELKKLNKELKDQKLDAFAAAAEKAGKKLEDFGKKMAIVSAGAAALIVGSAKAAIDFESAFAGVQKTCDEVYDANGNLVYSYKELEEGIRSMAKVLPSTTTEIAGVAETAGQLGVKTQDVLGFTRVMIDMGESTNLAANDAATTLAKFANITGLAADTSEAASVKYSRLGSTIVALGNNYATTEADIANMAMNLASAGTQVGMSESDILALSTALSSVGLESQAGGTAFSKAIIQMQLAVETGNDSLVDFANVAGMSTQEFSKAFKEDATGALQAFIKGLSDTGEETESAIKILDDMGITETRLRDALLRSAQASDVFSSAISMGADAWEENTALATEAEKRYATTEAQMKMLKNEVVDLGISFGQQMLPHIRSGVDALKNICEWFGNLDESTQGTILKVGLFVAALAPAAIALGKVSQGVSAGIKGYKTMRDGIQALVAKIAAKTAAKATEAAADTASATASAAATVAQGAQTAATTAGTVAQTGLNTALLANPITWVVLAIAGLIAAFVGMYKNSEAFREVIDKLWAAIKKAFAGIIAAAKQLWEKISPVFEAIGNTVGKVFGFIGDLIGNTMKAAGDTVAEKLNNMKDAYDANGGGIKGIVAGAWEGIKGYYSAGFTFVDNLTGGKLTEIKNKFLESKFGQAAQKTFDAVKEVAGKVMSAAKDTVVQNLDNMKTAYEENGGGIKGVVAGAWEGIKGYYSAGFTFVDNLTGGKLTEVKEKFSAKLEEIKTAVSEKITAVKETFMNIFNAIKDTVTTVFETIKNVITVAIMLIKEIFTAAFTIITLPFRFIWENCKETIIAVWDAITAKINAVLTTIKMGITAAWDAVKLVFTTVWNAISSVVVVAWDAIWTKIRTILATIKMAIIEAWTVVKNTFMTVWNAIKTLIQTVWDAIKAKIDGVLNVIKAIITAAWTAVKNTVTNAVNAVKTTVTNVFNAVRSTVTSVWNAIKSAVETPINAAKNTVSNTVNGMKNTVSNVFNSIKSAATSTWNAIKNAIMTPINAAKTAVSNAIDAIKNKFNFSWSLPKLKLPHFSISGSFSLNPPSIPKFGVQWYKTGGIMTNPTAFGMNGNNVMVGGEAGAEAILPLAEFYTRLSGMLDQKLDAIKQMNNVYVETHNYIDSEEVASKTTYKVDGKLVTDRKKRR